MFQKVADAPDTSAPHPARDRVKRIRAELDRLGLDAFLVPRADEFQGEYVPPSADRLRWVTGFTGSAGFAIVGRKAAVLFVDGRYAVQSRNETDPSVFALAPVPAEKPAAWLAANVAKGGVVGYDPRLHTLAEIERLSEVLAKPGIALKALTGNPVDRVWGDERPEPPANPVVAHAIEHAGRAAADKIAAVQKLLRDEGQDAVVLTQTESVCWLLNIRGSDVAHTPVVLAFALVPATGRVELFVAPECVDRATKAHLGRGVWVRPPGEFVGRLGELKAKRSTVRLDADTASAWIARCLGGGKRIVRGGDPCTLPKAIKNAVEIAGSRAAHVRDGIAMVRFLAWLDATVAARTPLDEITVVERLEAFRRDTGALREISFDTIAGSGPNGAIVHYRVDRSSNRRLAAGELLLVDSGGQYLDATTDITRTVAIGRPTAEMRQRYTQVLRGHVAISQARFPLGTRGIDLDPLARSPLWQAGVDFDHGTGHGVGSYLSVHEGPASISRRGMAPLEPGMIISNEPGYYKEGAFGIRIENLVLVAPLEALPGGNREMMSFETLTLCPYDRRLIDLDQLQPAERAWLDAYHARVRKLLSPALSPTERQWLDATTGPL